MSEQTPMDPLDRLLSQWVDQRAVRRDRLDDLQDRIVLALVEDRNQAATASSEPMAATKSIEPVGTVDLMSPAVSSVTLPARAVNTKRARLTGFLVGVTLMAMTAFVWLAQSIQVKRTQPLLVEKAQAGFPDYARLDDDQIQNRTVLHSEMKELFGHQLAWLAETDERVEVGLSDRPPATSDESRWGDAAIPLLVRVVIEKRAAAHNGWELAWTVDVVSQSEELIEIAPEVSNGTSMRLWAYVMPDGVFAVDSELVFSTEGTSRPVRNSEKVEIFRSESFNIQQNRIPSAMLLTGSDGVQYRVLQTVAGLKSRMG